jgi:16S rRNA (cytosine1402-N4)-methyltransferase
MEVNDEVGALKDMLQQLPDVLNSEGRIVIITFHSIEDRLVKTFFKNESFEEEAYNPFDRTQKESKLKIVTKKPVVASADELKKNSRSRSAKLRVAERV